MWTNTDRLLAFTGGTAAIKQSRCGMRMLQGKLKLCVTSN